MGGRPGRLLLAAAASPAAAAEATAHHIYSDGHADVSIVGTPSWPIGGAAKGRRLQTEEEGGGEEEEEAVEECSVLGGERSYGSALPSCATCSAPVTDRCKYDVSGCVGLEPGASCEVRCKAPYFGDVSLATCPADNTRPSQMVVWLPQVCSYTCPDPSPVPDGYMKGLDGWTCSTGYVGRAELHCSIDSNCTLQSWLMGCIALVPCAPPLVGSSEVCQFNVSACAEVTAGSSCEVSCMPPYVGSSATVARCPADNTDPLHAIPWTKPNCTFVCAETFPVPAGYDYNFTSDTVTCGEGYYGHAAFTCGLSDACDFVFDFAGCAPPVPCSFPRLRGCEVDSSDCSAGVPAGASCSLRCRAPHFGVPTIATCPHSNTNSSAFPSWSLPTCTLQCPDPPIATLGYLKDDRGWQCEEGYVGTAKVVCVLNDDCTVNSASVKLTGCTELMPCWAPTVEACKYAISDCQSVAPGGSCLVHCRPPYTGGSAVGRCPEGNTDPWRELQWSLPNCSLSCTDLDLIPVGYVWTSGGWRCDNGYTGSASVACDVEWDCTTRAELIGCEKLVACQVPELSYDQDCRFDMTECPSNLPPGATCKVYCKDNYHSNFTVMHCPGTNTDPGGLLWDPPLCEPICPVPQNVPESYMPIAGTANDWQCTSGYDGIAKVSCTLFTSCNWVSRLSGCEPLLPCAPLQMDTCEFDFSSCRAVQPGDSCEVRCREPYRGAPSAASCPPGNLDPEGPLRWTPPSCSFRCPPPQWRVGYDYADGWVCAAGYTGTPEISCNVLADCTVDEPVLNGCRLQMACVAPEVDPCKIDISHCIDLMAGSTCEVRCRPPFVGSSTVASCDANNTVPGTPLRWHLPKCTCPDPVRVPAGYVKTASGWECDEGYLGTAVKRCSAAASCLAAPQLSGCARFVPCAPLQVETCEFSTLDCASVGPGSSCTVPCRPPYVGTATVAHCPAGNVDPLQQLHWEPPVCSLDCPLASGPPPRGYERSPDGAGWQCAEGYGGDIEVVVPPLESVVEPRLTGCAPRRAAACAAPALDECRFDAAECAGIGPGSSCSVHCRPPFTGDSTRGRCIDGSPSLPHRLQWKLPHCHRECVDLLPVAAGYVKISDGWSCAEGYMGDPVAHCRLGRDCEDLPPALTGCDRVEPCLPPAVDLCKFDITDCLPYVEAGSSCIIRTKPPYNVTRTVAQCPGNNTDPRKTVDWTPPVSPLVDCLDPSPLPVGYMKTLEGWRCAPGYGGLVVGCCHINEMCTPRLRLAGCTPLRTCTLPVEDACKYNIDCASTLLGSSCEVSCRTPYFGAPTVGNCTGPGVSGLSIMQWPPFLCNCTSADCPVASIPPQQLNYRLPACTCPDPPSDPPGYTKASGSWQCARGYNGTAVKRCQRGADCIDEAELVGCSLIVPCVAMDVDVCMLNISNCTGALAGEDCTVHCRYPYVGPSMPARCPANNTDPTQAAVFLEDWNNCTLECPDPSIVPPGYFYMGPPREYVITPSGWQCAAGYAGTPVFNCTFDETCDPNPEPIGCNPIIPCASPTLSLVGSCTYDVDSCSGVAAGATCEVRCKSPFAGPPGVGTCRVNNTDPDHEVELALPDCSCPETCFAKEDGYVQVGGRWQCDENYTGAAVTRCVRPTQCIQEPEVSGCEPVVPCVAPVVGVAAIVASLPPPEPGEVTSWCGLDVSGCAGADSGSLCEVRCMAPFIGTPANASCRANNTNPAQVVDWSAAECRMEDCPDLDPIPMGYEKTADGWRCAEGYIGTVELTCGADDSCRVGTQPTGCIELMPCQVPDLDLCVFDLSNCTSYAAGTQCEVQCADPYEGTPTLASCPDNNTSPSTELDFQLPECVASPVVCPDPSPVPRGYARTSSGWQCAEGFFGTVSIACNQTTGQNASTGEALCGWLPGELSGCFPLPHCRRCPRPRPLPAGYVEVGGVFSCAEGFLGEAVQHCSSCSEEVQLAGCAPPVPCVAPEVDPCAFDVSECWALKPGLTCSVRVRTPYIGPTTTASCPWNNTDPRRRADWSPPELDCPEPTVVPIGYVQDGDGGWKCADGFAGPVAKRCQRGTRCIGTSELAGCLPLASCPGPVIDTCEYEMLQSCPFIYPRYYCRVGCRAPFVGPAQSSRCPHDNTDPERVADWDPEPCHLQCPDPDPIPAGYVKAEGGWQCASGYTGNATHNCSRRAGLDAPCVIDVSISGCARLEPCVAPAADYCIFDTSTCSSVQPGSTCHAQCKSPYVGNASLGSCPARNTDPAMPLSLTLPSCSLQCPDPHPSLVPPGYVKAAGVWQCAEDYTGSAIHDCSLDGNCSVHVELYGCTAMFPCTVPEVDECRFNMSDCIGIQPGLFCSIPCSEAYAGDASAGVCPPHNTDPEQPIVWSPPRCTLQCPDPSPMAGYAKGATSGWQCADGYAGAALVMCDIDENCTVTSWFTGCTPKAPCLLPTIDLCELPVDLSACNDTSAGASCEVRCMEPYVGNATMARCPADNIDPFQLLQFTPPSCRCPGPSLAPTGYKKNSSGWYCDAGYVGTANITCRNSSDCTAEPRVFGCKEIVPCAAPAVDACVVNASSCSSVQPGSSCTLQCTMQFAPKSSLATCPDQNTDPGGLQWSPPLCACKEPVATAGYTRTASGWVCDNGYLGTPSVICPVNATSCEVSITLVGCHQIVPCSPFPYQCELDNSTCPILAPGHSCEVHCADPFIGDPVNASCPADNIDPAQVPLWDGGAPPECGLSLCPDPDVLPPEYVKNGLAWECTPGYAGQISMSCPLDEDCKANTELSGCLPVKPCAPLVLDTCRYNTSACASVNAGDYCVVRCVLPYVGNSVGAACRADNTDPNGKLVLPVLPNCRIACPDPYPMPPGYMRTDNGLECTAEYDGTVVVDCARSGEGCGVTTTLSGCLLLYPCTVPYFDPCVYDVGCSDLLEPGDTCSLGCRAPYVGPSTTASCPADNTFPVQDMLWTPRPLICECPDPCPVPPGYVLDAGGNWQCDTGYVGTAEKRCSYQSTCYEEPRLFGCAKIVPCAPLEVEACDIDASNCSRVHAGQTCEVHCRAPYRGNATIASCPAQNTDPDQPLVWSSPVCRLPACADPHPVPIGYVKSSSGWRCADGYAGNVEHYCTINEHCTVGQLPTGCLPLQPCVDPVVDDCMFDVSSCVGVQPDTACKVRCQPPFVGSDTSANCPTDNVNASQELELVLPDCSCPDPEIIPEGYEKRAGVWHCASGYGGVAVKKCRCLPRPELQGCAPLVPCIIPAVDMCKFDFSNCSSVQPGFTCEVHCRPPYQEGSNAAMCPLGNTNPLKELEWSPLPCIMLWGDCKDPLPVPEGYAKTNASAASGWQCAEGYVGTVEVPCGPWENCRLDHRPVGCKPVAPCAAPDVDTCMIDASECNEVPPGLQCSLRCKPPFVGNSTNYTCPADNADPSRAAEGSLPQCMCPDPAAVPAGYIMNTSSGTWLCAEGYAGQAQKVCRHSAYCMSEPELIGCVPSVPCAVPAMDPCKYDASDCLGMQPGSSCQIRCRAPYDGNSTTASCPLDIHAGQELEWEQPQCSLSECPAPQPMPAGYARISENSSEWHCSDGYSGTALAYCTHDGACNAFLSLHGCTRAVVVSALRCSLPSTLDPCKYDLSHCLDVIPGSSCRVHCKAPFVGEPTAAACPAWSPEGAFALSWSLPDCNLEDCNDPDPLPAGFQKKDGGLQCADGYNGSVVSYCKFSPDCHAELVLSGCSLAFAGDRGTENVCIAPEECDDPEVVPEGYVKTGAGWRCADGYEGTAMKQCRPIMQCLAEPKLRGCVPLQPCAPLMIDSCEFDVSACTRVAAGSYCEIPCKAPYSGNTTFGRCQAGNVDARRPLEWSRPRCSLQSCPERSPVPVGYVKTIEGWQCAEGFAGTPSVDCTLLGNCEVDCAASGCSPHALCVVPPVDACELNVSQCLSVEPGGSCEVHCNRPYEGNSTTAFCPVNARGPVVGELLQLTPPDCSCGDPEDTPMGYVKAGAGWECAEGFVGTVVQRCRLGPDACLRDTLLSGCVPLAPCQKPDVDYCQFNVSSCSALEPGEQCEVECIEPYYGNSTLLTCPGNTTDQSAVPQGQMPPCVLECPDPPIIPAGYEKHLGKWTCADGYEGSARTACSFDDRCATASQLVGCTRRPVPCAAPRLTEYDACIFNVTNCEGVEPGSSCVVSCLATHLGTATVAFCPANNYDPDAPPQWTPPKCKLTNSRARKHLVEEFGWITDENGGLRDILVDAWLRLPLEEDCQEPTPLPPGYLKNASGWFCAEGHVGQPATRCGTRPPGCDIVLELAGCEPLVPCVAPAAHNCTADVSDCWALEPGGSCRVRCRRHCQGQATPASCPAGNTDPNRPLSWSPPNCTCGVESPAPLGYINTSTGWQCAEGFTGQVVPRCRYRLEEISYPELFGCQHVQPCTGGLEESCMHNVSDCAVVHAGSTCTVRCKPPHYGPPAIYSCPDGNTDTLQVPEGVLPRCVLKCPTPVPVPMGYVKAGDDWLCAEGYNGIVQVSCSMDAQCAVTTTISGCLPLVPCALPIVDDCAHNLTNCTGTMPGEFCEITCKAPFTGGSTRATCPAGNTDPSRALLWIPPDCVLRECPDPVPLPVAYRKSWNGYRCNSGYLGRAEKVCGYNDTCSLTTSFVGCKPVRVCGAPVADTCRFDVSNCSGLGDGELCQLHCRAPYVGNSTQGQCPRFNTDPEGLRYQLPTCELPPGVDLVPVPAGYMRTSSGWRCAPGHDGALATRCTAAPGADCRTHISPMGCATLVPCSVGDFHDLDRREGVLTGNLTFGPAQLNDRVSETGIRNYKVFFADRCNQTLGSALDIVVKGATDLSCCKAQAYTAELVSAQVPPGAEGLIVFASTSSLTSAIGVVVPFQDLRPPPPAPTPPPAPAAATRAAAGGCLVAALAAAWRCM